MVTPYAILCAILAVGSSWAERNDPRVPAHLERIAVAISEEARDEYEAAALVAISRSESAFSIRVQAGPTGSGALSDWQLEGKSGKFPGPFVGLKLGPIRNAAHAAIAVWRMSRQCGVGPRNQFTSYAGRPCGIEWPTLETRVARLGYARMVMRRAS